MRDFVEAVLALDSFQPFINQWPILALSSCVKACWLSPVMEAFLQVKHITTLLQTYLISSFFLSDHFTCHHKFISS